MAKRFNKVLLGVILALGVAFPTGAGIFDNPEPELIYKGSGPGLQEGILVIRDAEALAKALEGLDPAYGGPPIDIKNRTVLKIVGRPRENRCRDTELTEVGTRTFKATAQVNELVPAAGCTCSADPRPPRVFLVTVAHRVRSAEVIKTDRVLPCPEAEKVRAKAQGAPTLLLESSWDHEPGVKVIANAEEYSKLMGKLGLGERGPAVDWKKDRVVAVTGRPRENGCRKTKLVEARIDNPEEAEFVVEEHYPSSGQMCAQVFVEPILYLFRVPSTVMRAKIVTREDR